SQFSLIRGFVDPWTIRGWRTLGPPALLHAFDLAVQSLPSLETETTIQIEREGNLGGFLVHFDADLAEGIRITTEPSSVQRSNHWRAPLWLLPSVITVQPGELLTARSGLRGRPTFEILKVNPITGNRC